MNERLEELIHQTAIIYNTEFSSVWDAVWCYLERVDKVLSNDYRVKMNANRY